MKEEKLPQAVPEPIRSGHNAKKYQKKNKTFKLSSYKPNLTLLTHKTNSKTKSLNSTKLTLKYNHLPPTLLSIQKYSIKFNSLSDKNLHYNTKLTLKIYPRPSETSPPQLPLDVS